MCVWASYGPVDGLSPCASPGYENVRLVGSISCESVLFLPISVLMQTELNWFWLSADLYSLRSEFWIPSLA